jgi:hypothetical protein
MLPGNFAEATLRESQIGIASKTARKDRARPPVQHVACA